MGKCKGCGKLGRMVPRNEPVDAYHFSLLLSPVVSVWDCIVRKMRLKLDEHGSVSGKLRRKTRRLEKVLATSAANPIFELREK
ncbi:hypothetical protein NC652_010011 [Populus alba x Populus x berolinensis]|nr:hypothetical protein NC652_010011 [Populus alba x Populus x berolinensis]